MNFAVLAPPTQEKARVARLADKYISGPAAAPANGDQAIAMELMNDIVRLAKKCERMSGSGCAVVVIEARQTADLLELAEIRDGLVCFLTTFKKERQERRREMGARLLALGSAAAVSIPAALLLGVPTYLILKAVLWD